MSFLGRLIDPIGLTHTGGSIKNGFDPLGLVTKDANSGKSGAAAVGGIDPTLENELMGYYASNPTFAETYNRLAASGGTGGRSPAEWIYDHIQANPQDQQKFSSFVSGGGAGGGGAGTVPLEQDLLGRVITRGYADADKDAQRQKEIDDLFGNLQGTYDNNRRLISDLSGGQLYQQELNNLNQSTADRLSHLSDKQAGDAASNKTYTTTQLGDLDTYNTGIGKNIDTEVGALQTGLNPVLAARLKAAGANEAAINLSGQDARDQIQAQDALKGFVGGSSTLDQSLARADTGARQAAAGVRGDAVLANATDQYGLDKYGANQRRSLGDTYTTGVRSINDDAAKTQNLLDQFGNSETRSIKDAGSTGGFTLFENDINRRIGGLGLPTQFANDYIGAKTAGDNYANTGLNRLLTQLNWFASSPSTPSASAITTQPTDNGLAQLGTGIAGIGTSLLSNPSWQNLFKTKTPASTTGYTGD